MPHPLPRTQCRHQTPGAFSKSSTAITLQHSVQVPHALPGATRDKASAAASGAAGGLAEFASELMPIAFARNCVRCRGLRSGSVQDNALRLLRTGIVHIDGIDRRAGADEQTVLLWPSEGEIGNRLGKMNLADQIALRRVAAHAVFFRVTPPVRHPDISLHISAYPVGETRLEFGEDLAVRKF